MFDTAAPDRTRRWARGDEKGLQDISACWRDYIWSCYLVHTLGILGVALQRSLPFLGPSQRNHVNYLLAWANILARRRDNSILLGHSLSPVSLSSFSLSLLTLLFSWVFLSHCSCSCFCSDIFYCVHIVAPRDNHGQKYGLIYGDVVVDDDDDACWVCRRDDVLTCASMKM